jgi:1-acyl-sn-glycerol-3-phosphate acyltransferase
MTQTINDESKVTDWRTTKRWYTHETLFIKTLKVLVKAYYFPQVKLERVGFENIPPGPAILMANHISSHDPTMLGVSLPPGRHPYFMAKKELFDKFDWLIRRLGAFPVNRGQFDIWAFDHVGKILAAGQLCTIFAEGSRSGKEKVTLRKAKTGAVRLAARYQVPILPCAIIGTEKLATRKQFKGWRAATVQIKLGKLVDVPSLAPEAVTDHRSYRELTDQIMVQIARMLPPANRGYYSD